MDGHPRTREDCYQTTPYDSPDRPTVSQVGTTIFRQRAVFDDWDRSRVDRDALKQAVEKEEKEHREGRCVKRLVNATPFVGKRTETS